MRHDVGECSVEGALAVEGALELQEGAVPLVGGLLGQRERLLAAHRMVPEMRWRIGSKKRQKQNIDSAGFGHIQIGARSKISGNLIQIQIQKIC